MNGLTVYRPIRIQRGRVQRNIVSSVRIGTVTELIELYAYEQNNQISPATVYLIFEAKHWQIFDVSMDQFARHIWNAGECIL